MKKILSVLCIGIMLTMGLSGCEFFTGEDDLELTQEEIQSLNQQKYSDGTSGNSVRSIKTLLIYSIDSIDEQLVPSKVAIDTSRITPELVVDKVLENMDDTIAVTEIEVEKSRIYVTFNDEYAPIKKCSKKYETLILDCISNSLLDNISYVEEVVFRSERGAYRSDNFSFAEDEVYSSK